MPPTGKKKFVPVSLRRLAGHGLASSIVARNLRSSSKEIFCLSHGDTLSWAEEEAASPYNGNVYLKRKLPNFFLALKEAIFEEGCKAVCSICLSAVGVSRDYSANIRHKRKNVLQHAKSVKNAGDRMSLRFGKLLYDQVFA